MTSSVAIRDWFMDIKRAYAFPIIVRVNVTDELIVSLLSEFTRLINGCCCVFLLAKIF
jgi:hypothetical protein